MRSKLEDSQVVCRIASTLLRIHPAVAFVACVLAGMTLLACSAFVGVHNAQSPPPPPARLVGFLAAVNWSLTYPILFPLLVYFLLGAMRQVPRILERIAARGMFRSAEPGLPLAPADAVAAEWHNVLTKAVGLWLFIGLPLAVLYSGAECFAVCLRPLILNSYTEETQDWSIAATWMSNGNWWNRAANGAFDVLCYTFQAAIISVIFAFVYFMVAFAVMFDRDRQPRLVPDCASSDARRGFQHLAPLLEHMLWATLTAYLIAYLVRIQKLYLTSTDGSANLWEYVHRHIHTGFLESPLDSGLLDPTGKLDIPTMLVILGTFCVFGTVLFIVATMLSRTARDARDWAQDDPDYLEAEASRTGLTPDEIRSRLTTMRFWPMRYPALSTLTLLLGLGVVCLVFYRVGLYVSGLVISALVTKTVVTMRLVNADGGQPDGPVR